jgi:hypothetical protein
VASAAVSIGLFADASCLGSAPLKTVQGMTDADGGYRVRIDTVGSAATVCAKVSVSPPPGSGVLPATVTRSSVGLHEEPADSIRVDVRLEWSFSLTLTPGPDTCSAGDTLSLFATVKDPVGAPLAGAQVNFGVLKGSGSVTPSPVSTGSDGIAKTVFTCGNNLGVEAQIVRAAAGQVTADWHFAGAPGPAASVTLQIGPDPQTGGPVYFDGTVIDASLTGPLWVRAMAFDQFGNGVPRNSVLDWIVVGGGGSVESVSTEVFYGGMSSCPRGCSYNRWSLGTTGNPSVKVVVRATPSVSRTLTLRRVASPLQVTQSAATGLSVTAGGTLSTPLTLHVADANSAPLELVRVSFYGGVGGSTLTATEATAPDGSASAIFHAGTVAGDQVVSAEVITPLPTPAIQWTITVLPGPATVITGGGTQAGLAGHTIQISAGITDQYGNGVGGETVNWAVTSGGGSIAANSSVSNAAGSAVMDWTLGPVSGLQNTQTVTATFRTHTVTFTGVVYP